MPPDDGCLSEQDAYKDAESLADDICALAEEAYAMWQELVEKKEECIVDLGERPEIPSPIAELGDPPLDPMDVHQIEEAQEKYDKKLQECLDSDSSVEDAANLYLDLKAECEVTREEASALKDEYDACLHALNEGIPFA